MRIAGLELPGNLMLAPMAGFTDFPTRVMCREQGCAYALTEMVSARSLILSPPGLPQLEELLARAPDEGALGVQLFGFEPEDFAEAAKRLAGRGFDAVEINMGCPAPKVVKSGAGSALLNDLPRAAEIIRRTVRATTLPVGVKARTGWDSPNAAAPLARIAQAEGAAYIVVHGRTRAAMFGGTVDLDTIAAVKDSVSIPVIGNGDIRSPGDAERMLRHTRCDGLMIGRAAIGDPWIFARLGGRDAEVSVLQRLEEAVRHARMQCEWKGERRAITEMRARLAAYLRGCPGAARWRAAVNELAAMDQLLSLVDYTVNNASAALTSSAQLSIIHNK